MKKLLFVSNEASLTGAPLVLLNFIKWISSNHPDIEMHILFLKDGERMSEFAKHCVKCYMIPQEKNFEPFKERIFRGLFRKLNIKQQNETELLLNVIASQNYDCIFANTVVTIAITAQIADLSQQKPKFILHVHELELLIRNNLTDLEKFKSRFDKIIAVSDAVRQNLVNRHNVDKSKIELIYPFVSLEEQDQTNKKDPLLKELIIGGSGLVHWRKGFDLFLLVAQQVRKLRPALKVKFQWVGKLETEFKNFSELDMEKMGISDIVEFTGQTSKPLDYFKNFTVFLMTSREDPFPLVNIEVGSLGIPIICFKDAGGTEELLAEGGGKVIPYFDTNAMANEILHYIDNPAEANRDGQFLQQRVKRYTTQSIAPVLFQVINAS